MPELSEPTIRRRTPFATIPAILFALAALAILPAPPSASRAAPRSPESPSPDPRLSTDTPNDGKPQTAADLPAVRLSTVEQGILDAVNRERRARERDGLDHDPRLVLAARALAKAIAAAPRAPAPEYERFVREVDYPFTHLAQLTSTGVARGDAAVRSWAADARAVEMLAGDYDQLGVGTARDSRGALVVALLLAKPQPRTETPAIPATDPATRPQPEPEPEPEHEPADADSEPDAGAIPRELAAFPPAEARVLQETLRLHNEERAALKLPPLRWNARLLKAALAHAEDQAERRVMSHTGGDGSDPAVRAKRAGYRYLRVAENVAYGQRTAKSVMNAWMNSPPHKANILGPFRQIGVARAHTPDGVPYWCAVFGVELR